MPRLAPHESTKPTWCTRNGSASSRTIAAKASTRRPVVGDRRRRPAARTAAIAIARSTDGSHRVIVPKHTRTASAMTTGHAGGAARSNGANSASTNATFSPDTAVRCVSPAARNCSVSSSGRRGVTEQEPGEQGTVDRLQVRRAGEHQPAQPVGDTVERRPGRSDADDLGRVHLPHRVLPPPTEVEAVELGAPAVEHDRLPRRQQPQLPGDVARSGHEHPSPSAARPSSDSTRAEHACVEPAGVGVVDQRRDAARVGVRRDRAGDRRDGEPVECALHEAAPSSATAEVPRRYASTACGRTPRATPRPTPTTRTPSRPPGPRLRPPGSHRPTRRARRSGRPAGPAGLTV